MATEKKVFDVGKPGDEKPQTGSKPMVIGHKGLLSDPTIKADTDESKPEKTEDNVKKVEIKPLTMKDKEPDASVKPDEKVSSDESTTKEAETEKPLDVEEKQTPEQTKQEKLKEETQQGIETEEKLQTLIKSKEYFVPIKESNKTAVKTFANRLILIVLVGLIVTVLLIDAEIIDLGVELPFDIL